MPSFRHEMAVQLVKAQPRALNLSLDSIRRLMDTFAGLMPLPKNVRCEQGRVADLPAEWITPAGHAPGRTILYLHGGGYCAGSIVTHRALAARVAVSADARLVLIDYRLAPEDLFPAALEDARAAFAALVAEDAPERLVVMGDSAGGGLALALLLASKQEGGPLPAAAVCLSPWTDLAVTGHSAASGAVSDPMIRYEEIVEWGRVYAGEADVRNPLVSPLYGDLSGLPPLLVQVGERELLLDDSRRLAERARQAGVDISLTVYPDLMHVWHAFAPLVPESVEAIDFVGSWIQGKVSPFASALPDGGPA